MSAQKNHVAVKRLTRTQFRLKIRPYISSICREADDLHSRQNYGKDFISYTDDIMCYSRKNFKVAKLIEKTHSHNRIKTSTTDSADASAAVATEVNVATVATVATVDAAADEAPAPACTMYKVTERVFAAMQKLDIQALATYPENEIRPVLPSLVRMSLLSPLDNTETSMESRKQILAVLIGIEVVNSIVSYLQVNYHELESELKKELQTRQKTLHYEAAQQTEYGLQSGIALGFERADVARKVRVVLSEIFSLQQQVAEQKAATTASAAAAAAATPIQAEILDDGIYLEEVVDILCIALAELPSLFNILELTDALVCVPKGHRIVCALVANFPDCYRDVAVHIIHNCDEETNEGKQKLTLLMDLSDMNPTQALGTRAVCMDLMKVPSYMLKLCLKTEKHAGDLVPFLTGLLLGNDQSLRSWFAVYVRSSQKRKGDMLNLVRSELLSNIYKLSSGNQNDFNVQGAVLLRLYCALRGIAGLKFNDDEIVALSHLVTSRPQPTPSGVRFVTLALCMLIACPSLVSTTPLENKAIEWLQWLIKEDSFFGKHSDACSSLGEMLLLLAIHFHSNQINAISEMVCSTLAMKIAIRPNSTSRIKQVFTQDLFTEQVVASHAVRVPVTPNLNALVPGYLPVHCIHQLLKSRTFLKHKVPIKSWIFKQICSSVRPVHPVMPALVEVFVNMLIVPNPLGKASIDHMHRPFTESEIMHIFRQSQLPFLSKTQMANIVEHEELSQIEVRCPLTAQLLMLYYLMLYEDTRLMNLTAVNGARKQKEYSYNFLASLPMKYLLQKVHQYHSDYMSLFHPLLRLIISNYPHLSMVEDWLEEHYMVAAKLPMRKKVMNVELLIYALREISTRPTLAIRAFKRLLQLPPDQLAQYAEPLVEHLTEVLEKRVPRRVKDMYYEIWLRLNAVMPTTFWIMSLNAINNKYGSSNRLNLTNETLLEPLEIMRVPTEALCSPYLLNVMLRILKGCLAACKANYNVQIQAKQVLDKNALAQTEHDREELKTALIAAQESAAVQILLDVLAHMHSRANDRVSQLELYEIQGIIGTHLHQVFISEPSLAKLVHYQTYKRSVIPLIVASVPSMHICINFVHDFLNVNEMDKQIFTIELTSHLIYNYSLPKCLGVSKFCVNNIQTALSLLSTTAKYKYLSHVLPALIRFVETFPILLDDCINILMVTGRSLHAQHTLGITTVQTPLNERSKSICYRKTQQHIAMIENAFDTLITKIMRKTELY